MKSTVFFKLSAAAFCLLSVCTLSARPWQEIRKTGELRVLTADAERKGLHRVIMPIDREQGLLQSFARKHKLRITYVLSPDFSTLFSMLAQGQGDLISANLAETPLRKKEYLLSFPFDYTREIVFTSERSGIKGNDPKVLQDRTVVLLPGTSYVENFRAFTSKYPRIRTRLLPSTISHDALIEKVASGEISCSILNESDLDAWLAYRKGIRKLFALQKKVPLVFAAGKDSTQLIRELNIYIAELNDTEKGKTFFPIIRTISRFIRDKTRKNESSPHDTGHASSADLPVMKKRGFIRILISNDAFTCYLKQGMLCGFEYELVQRFCDSEKVMAITVIPANFKDLVRYLEEGKGDLIAANFTCTQERKKAYKNKFVFCTPYGSVRQILIGREDEKIHSLQDLQHRKVFVRKGNAYYDTLMKLKAKGIRFTVVPVPENQPERITMQKVEQGIYDLTVVDEHFLHAAAAGGMKIKMIFPLTEKQSFAWVVRKNNPELAAAVNAFFKKENRSTFFNLTWRHYYQPKSSGKSMKELSLRTKNEISPFDSLFKKYGKIYNFHWYFLAAQSFQESRFQPAKVNHIGATGLMQVMPGTAKDLKMSNLTLPENGICAGSKYMAKLRNRFHPELKETDRLCFTLASYNAGYGHIQDARHLASRMGLDPDVWFNNVETALALLEDPAYAAEAKWGYCRASETIPYVRNIMQQTYNYKKLLDAKDQSGKAEKKMKAIRAGKKPKTAKPRK